ncbi:AAA family ATPase [Bacteroides reticulotermitis]|uniref:AAA family ATPase n=1 Tax=Bacteroides reticulotermitis TaxID=1133319 RepID=UPI003A88C95F
MKSIILKELHIENFQKFRNETFEFGESETHISGENRAGKTTIQSAMLWLLFGKDCYGQTDTGRGAFDIKRRVEGKTVDHADVLVSGVFLIDGKVTNLKRILHENWNKKNEYMGDETQCFVDETPYKVGEYQSFISSVINEEEFRMITNIDYFLSLPAQFQRNYLCTMGGVRTVADICKDNTSWSKFLDLISGKSLEDALKQISYEKKELRKKYDKIEPGIQSLEKVKPEVLDWEALKLEKDAISSQLEIVNDSLSDTNKLEASKQMEIKDLMEQVSVKRKEFYNTTNELQSLKQKAVTARKEENYQKDEERRAKSNRLTELISERDSLMLSITSLGFTAKKRAEEMLELMEEYNKMNASAFESSESETMCPLLKSHVCNSPELLVYIEKNREKAEADFNIKKKQKIDSILEEGKAKRKEKEHAESELVKAETNLTSLKNEIEALQTIINSMPVYADCAIAEHEIVIPNKATYEQKRLEINKEIAELEELLKSKETSENPDNSELLQKRTELNRQIEVVIRKLSVKEQIDKVAKEIHDLNEEGKRLANQITELENKEFTAKEINRAVVEDATERVNKLFEMTHWEMFEQQNNGGYAEVCKPTINGVSRSLNYEAKINIGIDICNAIARFKGVSAPLFIDNHESVNESLPAIGQVIKNYVAPKGTKLNIKNIS